MEINDVPMSPEEVARITLRMDNREAFEVIAMVFHGVKGDPKRAAWAERGRLKQLMQKRN